MADAGRKWTELPTWPGPPRMLAVAVAALDGAFFLMSGAELSANADGSMPPARNFLADAYRFTRADGWTRLADLPRPALGAPSPAMAGRGRILVVGGDSDGFFTRNAVLKDAHPGFREDVLAYDVTANAWSTAGRFPTDVGPDAANQPALGRWPAVTTPAATWGERYVIIAGEARPGVRTPRAYAVQVEGAAAAD